jgi:hypothetical protein
MRFNNTNFRSLNESINRVQNPVEIKEASMGVGRPNEPLSRTLKRAAKAMKISGKAPPKPTTTNPPEKKERAAIDEVLEYTAALESVILSICEELEIDPDELVEDVMTIARERELGKKIKATAKKAKATKS